MIRNSIRRGRVQGRRTSTMFVLVLSVVARSGHGQDTKRVVGKLVIGTQEQCHSVQPASGDVEAGINLRYEGQGANSQYSDDTYTNPDGTFDFLVPFVDRIYILTV